MIENSEIIPSDVPASICLRKRGSCAFSRGIPRHGFVENADALWDAESATPEGSTRGAWKRSRSSKFGKRWLRGLLNIKEPRIALNFPAPAPCVPAHAGVSLTHSPNGPPPTWLAGCGFRTCIFTKTRPSRWPASSFASSPITSTSTRTSASGSSCPSGPWPSPCPSTWTTAPRRFSGLPRAASPGARPHQGRHAIPPESSRSAKWLRSPCG